MAWRSANFAAFRSWLRPRPDANSAALQLMSEVLSPEQRAQYNSHGFFDVTGGQTGKRYRIRFGSQMNVEELDASGRLVRGLCFIPKGGLPIGDILVAQKLALELMEEETLHVARPGGWLTRT
jgi:hypothetical protein